MAANCAHNWNQFHRVLTTNLGWRQMISYDRDIISYVSPSGRELVIKKNNMMSDEYAHAILIQIGLDHQAFVKYYTNGHL
jgi:hypothetical protein